MATSVDSVLEMVKGLSGQMVEFRKTIDTMGRSRLEREDKVVKALFDGRGKAYTQKGRDLVDVMDVIDPRRCKSLGKEFQGFLRDVAHVSNPQGFHVKDMEPIIKSLDSMGAKPINKTALAEGSGATGGYLVPTQFSNELLSLAAEESFLRGQCRTLPMTNRTLLVPVLDQTSPPPTGGSSFYGGIVWTWQPEASNYQTNAETEPKFRQVELVARDLVGIVVASNQLLADNAVALDTILTTIFKDAMGWAYDYFFLQGNGANQPLGMLNSPCKIAVTKSVSAHFNLIDAANMMAQMVPSSYKTCVWAIHPSVLPELIAMTNGATNSPFLVWLNPAPNKDGGPLANDFPGTILGRPLYITEKLPKLAAGSLGSVALLDPNKYLVGDRMAIQIEASPYPNFTKNQMTWRIIARFDGQPEINAPITLADGSYTVSPVVLLQA